MKNADLKFDLKSLPQQLGSVASKSARYAPVIIFVLIASVYGFVLMRITMLANAQPTGADVSSEISQLTPHIDKNAAAQLENLEDNSVNVKSLFEEARNNPFGE